MSSSGEEDLIQELEDDDSIFGQYREKRLHELKQQALEHHRLTSQEGHGRVEELGNEKVVFEVTLKEPLCMIHFFHKDFRRCEILNKHLQTLASRYLEIRFASVDVEKCPFLVEKLGIKILPCLICFKDGVQLDRLVGFEDLGSTDNFTTEQLERRLQSTGALPKNEQATKKRSTILGLPSSDEDED